MVPSINFATLTILELVAPVDGLPALELLAVLAALLLLFLGAVVATRRAPAPATVDELHGWNALAQELDRSRRFRRPFTLMRIAFAAGHSDETLASLIGALPGRMRSFDFIWRSRSGLYILLPETDRAGALGLCARVRRTQPALMPDTVRAVSFPQDGITSGALLAALDLPAPSAASAWSALVSTVMGGDPMTIQKSDLPPIKVSDDGQG